MNKSDVDYHWFARSLFAMAKLYSPLCCRCALYIIISKTSQYASCTRRLNHSWGRCILVVLELVLLAVFVHTYKSARRAINTTCVMILGDHLLYVALALSFDFFPLVLLKITSGQSVCLLRCITAMNTSLPYAVISFNLMDDSCVNASPIPMEIK